MTSSMKLKRSSQLWKTVFFFHFFNNIVVLILMCLYGPLVIIGQLFIELLLLQFCLTFASALAKYFYIIYILNIINADSGYILLQLPGKWHLLSSSNKFPTFWTLIFGTRFFGVPSRCPHPVINVTGCRLPVVVVPEREASKSQDAIECFFVPSESWASIKVCLDCLLDVDIRLPWSSDVKFQ